jgi:hypothetical protein
MGVVLGIRVFSPHDARVVQEWLLDSGVVSLSTLLYKSKKNKKELERLGHPNTSAYSVFVAISCDIFSCSSPARRLRWRISL